MPDNPLKGSILSILKDHPEGLSEHALIRQLEAHGHTFDKDEAQQDLALFQTHFLVMNALYQLQDKLLTEGQYLAISPLSIRLETAGAGGNSSPTQGPDARLRAYYLDFTHLEQTTGADIVALMNGFWERYLAIDGRADALNTLGVTGEEGWPAIQQAYRRLAAEHHPDRGGDPERFMAIRKAYEVLSRGHAG
jgi:DnaJ-domain-containing protein 1